MHSRKPSLRSRPLIEVWAPISESTVPVSPIASAIAWQAISPMPTLSARTIAYTSPPSGPMSMVTTGTCCSLA